MRADDCFCPLRQKAEQLPDFIAWAIGEDPVWESHFGFEAFEIPSEFIELEPALSELNKIWPIGRLGLLKVDGMSVYDWHVDQHRLSCVNMLFSVNSMSHTLFGTQRDHLNKDVVELIYEPDTFYLFNNQVLHTVINLDSPRYLFSLYFEQEKDYFELKDLYNGRPQELSGNSGGPEDDRGVDRAPGD